MAQYIEKSALVAEIDRQKIGYNTDGKHSVEYNTVKKILDIINTLEVKEVDLEKEVADYIEQHNSELSGYFDIRRIARHFFALGLNSQTKDMQEALRMEYEKGRADVLRCIDPDVMVADFYSQPLSKTRSIASVYRQGIIDIIKRINNNEETSITSTRSIDDVGL